MTSGRLAVAVVGAGRWAQRAHIPGWQRDGRAEVVALADTNADALAEAAAKFGVARTTTDYRELTDDPSIDVIDVVTGNRPHYEISWAALSAGKHVLCEKPVNHDYRKTREAAELAASKGLKTKVGFTFRYAPAVQYAKSLIDSGFVGEPYMLNAFEQNSQWIDPSTPLRQTERSDDRAVCAGGRQVTSRAARRAQGVGQAVLSDGVARQPHDPATKRVGGRLLLEQVVGGVDHLADLTLVGR